MGFHAQGLAVAVLAYVYRIGLGCRVLPGPATSRALLLANQSSVVMCLTLPQRPVSIVQSERLREDGASDNERQSRTLFASGGVCLLALFARDGVLSHLRLSSDAGLLIFCFAFVAPITLCWTCREFVHPGDRVESSEFLISHVTRKRALGVAEISAVRE